MYLQLKGIGVAVLVCVGWQSIIFSFFSAATEDIVALHDGNKEGRVFTNASGTSL